MNSPAEKIESVNGHDQAIPGEEELVSLVDRLVRESGDPRGFDAAKWVRWWLREYVPALGNTPASFMGTPEGRALVRNVLEASQSGVYL